MSRFTRFFNHEHLADGYSVGVRYASFQRGAVNFAHGHTIRIHHG
jgi:hypothetical protein